MVATETRPPSAALEPFPREPEFGNSTNIAVEIDVNPFGGCR